MARPKRVGHIVLNVKDLAASTKFYTEILGFQVSRQRETGTFLTCGRFTMTSPCSRLPQTRCRSPRGSLASTTFGAGQNLADLKEAYEEFQANGVRLDHNTDHGMTSSMYFFDPDGNRIEYFCNNQDDPAVGLA